MFKKFSRAGGMAEVAESLPSKCKALVEFKPQYRQKKKIFNQYYSGEV
jgi:hypothetical protein